MSSNVPSARDDSAVTANSNPRALLKAGTPCPPLGKELIIGPDNYTCFTQENTMEGSQSSGPSKIVLGYGREIPRWKKGSVLKWAAYMNGYPGPSQAAYAANMLNEAAKEWNSLDLGVQFEWVETTDAANFILQYGGNKGDVMATAFFPNTNLGNYVYVMKGAFSTYAVQNMKNVFLHELGHVLGLRHEFALKKETDEPAVRFQSVNDKSVMSYEWPPVMQDTDRTDTKAFYESKELKIGEYEIKDKVPT